MRRKGSKVGYLWTVDPSGTCAKAVCSRLLKCNVEWGVRETVWLWLPCTNAENQILRFSNSWNHWKFSQNFIYRTIKRYKELWGVEDRAWSGRLESVRAEAAIKTVRERIGRNPLRKQKITSRELNISTRSGCGGTFRPLSAPRIGPRGVQTSTPGTINCGLFWRTWLAKSVTATWTAWRDPSWKQRHRSPWRRRVPR